MARARADLATLRAKAARCRTELSTSCRSSIRLALENDAGLRIFNVARARSHCEIGIGSIQCVAALVVCGSHLLFCADRTCAEGCLAQHSASTDSTNGAVIYALNCIKCHGADGGGLSGVVSMLGPSLKAEHDRQFVITMVSDGKAPMPSFRPLLSSAQIDAVADYVTT